MYLGFFILSALDLLSAYAPSTTPEERADHINWIYRCQHPKGGFRMWPGTDFGEKATAENAKWDPANLPATYFALATLLIVGDDFKRVRRRETLQWLRRMQREDGSFGETCVDGRIEGGRDPRFGYCAMGVRFILRGGIGEGLLSLDGEEVQDVNVDAFVRCIAEAEAYDGGIADEKFHEPHAGYTYCALGAMSFAGRLKHQTSLPSSPQGRPTTKLTLDPSRTLDWLVHEQTSWIDPDGDDPNSELKLLQSATKLDAVQSSTSPGTEPLHQSPDISTFTPTSTTPGNLAAPTCAAGFCGRPNKPADTCYAWWVCGALHLLPGGHALYDGASLKEYLLGKTQHPVLGGFSKFPGDPPDLYHSYLGLAALALSHSDEVKAVDGSMCISSEARSRVQTLWDTPA